LKKQASHGLPDSASFRMPIHAHFLRRVILSGKVCQTGLVFVVRSGFISRLQDYRSLCAAITISGSLVNIQTDTPTDTQTALSP